MVSRGRAGAHVCLAILLVMVAGCWDGAGQAATDGGMGLEVEMSGVDPLRGQVSFSTTDDEPPRIEITDPAGTGLEVTPTRASAGNHSVPILQVRPDTAYTVTVHADGTSETETFRTGSLPTDAPPVDATGEAATPSPGITLFDASPLDQGDYDGHLVAVDSSGRVVWHYRQPHSIQDAEMTDDGGILFITHETGIRRLDPTTGDIVEFSGTTGLEDVREDERGRAFAGPDAMAVDTDQMHHEVLQLPDGNLMTLSREVRTVEGFEEDLCDQGDAFDGSHRIGADTVVAFSPETGAVISEWSLFDLVDPLQHLDLIRPDSFCSSYLDPVYPDMEARDWTHSNGLAVDEARNLVWVSVRHLDQLLGIRYRPDDAGPAGELVWRLGAGGDFELADGEWFRHQHAPQVLEDGRILLYDNGNHRKGTTVEDPERLPYSRAVVYELDAGNMTARQVWESRIDTPEEPVYAPFVGDADMLDGSVLVTHGGLTDPPAHSPRGEGVTVSGRIVEVVYDSGDVLFDLRVRDDGGSGWRVYRSERLPTLYPPGYQVEPIEP